MIVNGSFELQAAGAQPGIALGWTVVESSTGEQFAEFVNEITDAGSRTSGQETFEGEWPAGFSIGVVELVGFWVDAEPCAFDAGLGDPTFEEDFENSWGSGSQGIFDFEHIPSEFALFGIMIDE